MIIVQVCFVLLLIVPIIWGIRNWLTYKGFSISNDRSYFITMVNSAVLYAIAFNLIFFLQELFLVLGKKALCLTSFLYHNNHTWEGEHPMTALMQGSGALGIFLIGWICLAIFRFIPSSRSSWRLFVLWVAFHGLMQSIPQVIIAAMDPGTDVGEALIGYLKLSQPVLIFLALISIFAMAMINIWFCRPLLQFAPKEISFDNPRSKIKYIRFIAVGAGLAGSLLIVPFRIPPINQAITPFVVFAFSVPWIWSAAASTKPVRSTSADINEKINWIQIIFLVLLLVFFRVVLVPGVEF